MREILFRGKSRHNNGRWVFGNLFEIGCEDDKTHYIMTVSKFDERNKQFNVYHGTVGEFTSKCDMNDTQIFEGDIVCYEEDRIMRVVFENCEFALSGDGLFVPMSEVQSEEVEVIGNIYDNPELLEVGK